MGRREFIHGLKNLSAQPEGCVATIGSFDGVHRGHMTVIQQVKDMAARLAVPSIAMVFEPQPHEYFARKTAPARLMRLREKVCALFDAGIDRVICLKFDETLRSLTAQDYIEQVLIQGLGVKHLVIGDDFRFGCDRSGDFEMLCQAGQQHGFSVCDTQTVLEDGERISSTRIRKLLTENQFDKAEYLLGKPFTLRGRVFYGKQLGRTIGFPTANVGIGSFAPPVNGVYAVEVSMTKELNERWPAVANIGVRPTVGGDPRPKLEVHVLDRQIQLYGEFVSVVFKRKIRDEQRFDSVDALKQQIENDSQIARQYFSVTSD